MSILDKAEKNVLIVTGTLIGLFIFSILYAKEKYQSDLPECLPYNKTYTEPKIIKLDDKTYQVFAVAQMWQFQPSEINIPAGSEVDFYLSSKDVVHGFHIYEKNVNMMAVYGAINKTTVKFDKEGVYNIVCHEYCGVGHQNMRAQVVVSQAPSNSP
jgi:cytochrome c oxidase subunit II